MNEFSKADAAYDEFLTLVKEMPRDVGKTFTDPDDDWMPIMVVRTDDGLGVVGFDSEFLADDDSKDVLAEIVIPGMIEQLGASAVALVMSAWSLKSPEIPDVRPSLHPERQEILVLHVIDAAHESIFHAPILRDGEQPPALGKWEQFAATATGRFV